MRHAKRNKGKKIKNRNKKQVVDWMVLEVFENPEDRNNPECEVEFHTSPDFRKYGFGEIVVIGKVKNAEKIMNLINTFGRMLIKGKNFDSNVIHCIDDINGVTKFKFGVVKYMVDGEKFIQLIIVE